MFPFWKNLRVPFGHAIRTLSSEAHGKVINYDHLKNKLQNELSTTFLELKDVSSCGCGQKFEALIVSPKFEGRSLLAQQRLVMSVLKDEMKVIHSFAQRTFTPEQWKQLQQDEPPYREENMT